MGLGATLTFDLWGLFLKQAFQITPSNICLVGRWLRYMPAGTFRHSNIGSTPQKSAECAIGWMAHYLIGITFAIAFVALAGPDWLQHATLIPRHRLWSCHSFGAILPHATCNGTRLRGSQDVNPTQARLRSLINHTAFGGGLYLFGLLVNGLLLLFA